MKKIKVITIVLSLVILSLTFIAANSPLRAQTNVNKLDQILQQQNDILQKLDLIREELSIIKNRI